MDEFLAPICQAIELTMEIYEHPEWNLWAVKFLSGEDRTEDSALVASFVPLDELTGSRHWCNDIHRQRPGGVRWRNDKDPKLSEAMAEATHDPQKHPLLAATLVATAASMVDADDPELDRMQCAREALAFAIAAVQVRRTQ